MSRAEGRLRCDHCGQTFYVHDGQHIKIDHFENCEASDAE